MSLAFKFFERLIVEQHPEYEFTTFSNAIEFLEKEGVMDLTKHFTNKALVIKELQKESLVGDGIDPQILIKNKIQKAKENLPPGIPSQQSLESIREALNQKMSEGKESPAQAEERRGKEEEKNQEALKNIIKEKKGEENGKE